MLLGTSLDASELWGGAGSGDANPVASPPLSTPYDGDLPMLPPSSLLPSLYPSAVSADVDEEDAGNDDAVDEMTPDSLAPPRVVARRQTKKKVRKPKRAAAEGGARAATRKTAYRGGGGYRVVDGYNDEDDGNDDEDGGEIIDEEDDYYHGEDNDEEDLENEAQYAEYARRRRMQEHEFMTTPPPSSPPAASRGPVSTPIAGTRRKVVPLRERGFQLDNRKAPTSLRQQRRRQQQQQQQQEGAGEGRVDVVDEQRPPASPLQPLQQSAPSSFAERFPGSPLPTSPDGSASVVHASAAAGGGSGGDSNNGGWWAKRRAIVNVIVLSLMVVFALGLHSVASRYLNDGVSALRDLRDLRPSSHFAFLGTAWGEAGLRLLYPALVLILIWVIKVYG